MSDAANSHPRELLSGYLDDELGVEERAAIDRHLAACEDCRAQLEALRRLVRAIADESVPPVPLDLAPRIGRRLDAATIVRPRRWRFVVPATIAATLGAIGILVALQWREGRLGAPSTLPAAPEASVPPREEKETQSRDALEKDLKKNSVEPNLGQNPQGVPGGVVGGVEGGGTAGEVLRKASADDDRRDRARSKVANELEGLSQPAPAAKAEAIFPCGDRWSDSGVHGTWGVKDVRTAVGTLDQIARDVGGVGVRRGVVDGRPYVLVVPRGRFEEVFFALRARGVAGLLGPPALPEGGDCTGISVALENVEGATAPPR